MIAPAAEQRYGWSLELGRVEYQQTLAWQHSLVRMREHGLARDTIITVEHPAVVTVGRNGHPENFEDTKLAPVFVERGGDVTYHGPGQLVIYFIFNLTRRGRDLHQFMGDIQDGIIAAVKSYGIEARRGDEYTGVWVNQKKLASIGVAVKHWITYHGAAVNLNTKLSDFRKIQPCGLDPKIMISLQKLLGKDVELEPFRQQLLKAYTEVFATEFTTVSLDSLAEVLESQSGGNEI